MDAGHEPEPRPRARGRSSPTRRALQSEKSRSDILDAAMRMIAQHGYREATIDLIADAAGISPTSIYWHFGNREGLLGALAMSIADIYVYVVTARVGEVADPEAHVRGAVRAVCDLAVNRPEVVRVQTALSSEGAMLPALREGIRPHNRQARAGLIKLVDRGVAEGTFRKVTGGAWMDFLQGSLMGVLTQASLHREGFDPRPDIELVHDAALLLLGLEPGCATR